MPKHDFELIAERHIAELNTTGFLYRHRTGARVLSLVNDDENKAFGINFRTPPVDSTGVAHILEHSVLCGSRKYPVKEPFVELLKGSLKTFLNAFTYPDRTCYPVASQNVQDFYNLVEVYLDAVLHPRLTPQVLQQEGWHYELESPDAPLTYKGVVYNEMKGANSSPDRVMAETVQQSLFPDNTYGVDSGGHPRHIPDLTWEEFEGFHRQYYHPANAWIYFCGDDDPERRLELLEEYLGEYEPLEVDSTVGPQPRFEAPRRVEETYAVSAEVPSVDLPSAEAASEEAPKSMVAVNWLLVDGIDRETSLGLQILEHILIGNAAAPLRKALIESGLGEDLTGTGMESELAQFFFSTGLKGVAEGREAEVEQLVIDQLTALADGGIDPETVGAALNTTEFRLRENNTGSYPRGLVLMLRSLTNWLYDGDPFDMLALEAPLEQVKAAAQQGGYFEGLIRGHLLDNTHRTTLFLKPDRGRAAREEAEEQARLAAARQAMSADDLERVMAEAAELKERQEQPDSPEDLARLPRLELADLDREIRRIPIGRGEVAGAPFLHHDLFTNGIVYADLGFDLRTVPQDLLPYLPLFGRSLLEMGLEKEDFVRLAQRIGSRTGGVWAHTMVTSHRHRPQAVARFFVRGKAMVDQVGDLLEIMRDVLLTVKLDNRERFLQMVLEERASEEAHIVPGGHSVVSLRLRSHFDEAAWVSEQMGGVSYLFFLRRLVEQVQNDWSGVLQKLEALRSAIVNRDALLCNATFPQAERAGFEGRLAGLVEALPRAPAREAGWTRPQRGRDEGRDGGEGLVIPAQVNYVGRAANLYDLGYELDGSVGVITRFLRNTWLWDRVRVQGGAYGAFCSFDHFTGVLSYVSYRDPNLLATLDNYAGSARYLRDLDLSRDELTKAIISTIGELDGYQLPDAKGYTSMVRELTGVDEEFRQQMRDAVLGASVDDFRAFAAVLERMGDDGRVVVLGSREALDKANAERGDWLKLVPVL